MPTKPALVFLRGGFDWLHAPNWPAVSFETAARQDKAPRGARTMNELLESTHEGAVAKFSLICDIAVSGSWTCFRTAHARDWTSRSGQHPKLQNNSRFIRFVGSQLLAV
jgi:hypothetical protein